MSFDPKDPAAKEFFSFDYRWQLADGETISSAVWTVSVLSGTDPSPASMLSGAAVIFGSRVSHLIIGGVEGVKYCVECKATTSAGQEIVLSNTLKVQDGCE
jgi:hypothetical protein